MNERVLLLLMCVSLVAHTCIISALILCTACRLLDKDNQRQGMELTSALHQLDTSRPQRQLASQEQYNRLFRNKIYSCLITYKKCACQLVIYEYSCLFRAKTTVHHSITPTRHHLMRRRSFLLEDVHVTFAFPLAWYESLVATALPFVDSLLP